jgi:hypothetical protein
VNYFQFYIWENFIPFLCSGACRINWTHAIQAPVATVKQQAVKALANIKEFMNEMCVQDDLYRGQTDAVDARSTCFINVTPSSWRDGTA